MADCRALEYEQSIKQVVDPEVLESKIGVREGRLCVTNDPHPSRSQARQRVGHAGVSGRAAPTPLSGRNRSAGRGATKAQGRGPDPGLDRGPAPTRACAECGGPTPGRRRTCGPACAEAARDARDVAVFIRSGPAALAALRAGGAEPLTSGARATGGAAARAPGRGERVERSAPRATPAGGLQAGRAPAHPGRAATRASAPDGALCGIPRPGQAWGGGAPPAVVGAARKQY